MTVSERRVLGSAGCSGQRESRHVLKAAGAAGRPACLSRFGRKMSKARSLPCGASSPDPVPKQSQRLGMCGLRAQPVDPTPSRFGSQGKSRTYWFLCTCLTPHLSPLTFREKCLLLHLNLPNLLQISLLANSNLELHKKRFLGNLVQLR